MRIVFIGQKGIPAKFGGVEKHVEEVAIRLVECGHEVFAYVRPNYTPIDQKEYKGVKLINIPSINTKYLDAISHTFFSCLDLWRRDVDIVHFHSIGPSFLIWFLRILKPKTTVVATFHTQCYYHQKWGVVAQNCLKMGEKVICHVPNATITVSKTLTEYVEKKYTKKPFYIPNGITDPVLYEPDKIKDWGLEKGNYILVVSRLVRHKGIHHLIKAYKEIATDKKLVIAGESAHTDDYVKEIKQLAQDNPNIIFTGNQTGEVLGELYSNAYLFVQPSESEGLSIALLEAMSYGKTVLVSDIPENLEAMEGVGYTFKSGDVNDLSEKLNYLLLNSEIVHNLEAKSREHVIKNYSWDDIVKDIIELYKIKTKKVCIR